MVLFADLMVLLGILALLASLKPSLAICRKTNEMGWQLMLMLIGLFIGGYSVYMGYLITLSRASYLDIAMATILFCGSLFVLFVTRASLVSLDHTEAAIERERKAALLDALTGLPNRLSCRKKIERYIRHDQPFCVMLFDVNNFKSVNDAMGHQSGDLLLKQIADRLADILPEKVFFARIGGDEFVILLETNDIKLVEHFYRELIEELSPRFDLQEFSVPVSISVGVSLFPHFSSTHDGLLRQADSAMYEAKRTGQGMAFYSNALENRAKEHLRIATMITSALHNQEFQLYYQPIVNTKEQTLYGYEALIRWPQADGSFIPPDLFIPVAERSHLIRDITDWVVVQVMLDLHLFANHGIHASIHLNLSAHDLTSRDLLDNLKQLVESEQLDSSRVVLEVTESDMLKDIDNTKVVLDELRVMGFKVSLDDFGTGYSSLTLLRELAIDQIKIDRSFVSSMHISEADHAIVTSSISLAHGLNCTVIAEGVEQSELIRLLDHANCDYVQGYINGKALSIDEIIYWTEQHELKMVSSQSA
ncbi:bifunctional diguanylate cyclase/phosphodiesterase [Vibrio sp. SCSIO 43136]|uniref:putative bifunctional diguanylate cyclase/phosphodiesterase n=1 Tax=Vibrio sp. SCSIO 43136 TaxID=2819101 RepID=UPI002075D6A4|nr:bifunctional diguanylate cyclase/phosphodiesterase [Vibrio sp. SCSIO 43136]USD68187.1 bifunctional diguanylate cyclase/phosphodiesterase [Vibrio sp. SCSIO 43136]